MMRRSFAAVIVVASALSGPVAADQLHRFGRYDELARDVERVLALEPHHDDTLSGMGLVEPRQHPAETLEWFDKGAAASPKLGAVRGMADELETKAEGKPI